MTREQQQLLDAAKAMVAELKSAFPKNPAWREVLMVPVLRYKAIALIEATEAAELAQ